MNQFIYLTRRGVFCKDFRCKKKPIKERMMIFNENDSIVKNSELPYGCSNKGVYFPLEKY